MDQISTTHIFRSDQPGWVYVIRGEMTGLLKVGIAAEPDLRMRALQGASPDRLSVLALFPAEKAGVSERALHRRFGHARVHGEWFRPTAAMLEWAGGACKAPGPFKVFVQAALDAVWERRRA